MPIDDENFTEKICEACGAKFSCGAEIGQCWCFEMEISGDELAEIGKNFKDCLCPQCLPASADQRRLYPVKL